MTTTEALIAILNILAAGNMSKEKQTIILKSLVIFFGVKL